MKYVITIIVGLVVLASGASTAEAATADRVHCGKVWRGDAGVYVGVTGYARADVRLLPCRTYRKVVRDAYSDGSSYRVDGRSWRITGHRGSIVFRNTAGGRYLVEARYPR